MAKVSTYQSRSCFFPVLFATILSCVTITEIQALSSCSTDADCPYNIYCCEGEGYFTQYDTKCAPDCLNHSCSYDSDCAPGEHCRSDDICQKKPKDGKCDSDADCVSGRYCCEKIGTDDNDCEINCLFESCEEDSDCSPDECCDNHECRIASCDSSIAGWLVAVVVISIIVSIAIPVAIIVCCFCGAATAFGRGRAGRGMVLTQPATGTTVVALQSNQAQQPTGNTYPTQSYPMQPYPPPQYGHGPSPQQYGPPAQQYGHPPAQQYGPPPQQYPPQQNYPGAPPPYPPTQQPHPPNTQPPPSQSYPPHYQIVPQEPPPEKA